MKILVTGSTGFLGSVLCPYLESQHHEVVRLNSKTCDLTGSDSLSRFSRETYDQIYHLATWTQAGDFCLRHPGEQWIVNQQINTHVLAWWQRHQPQAKLISIGTSCSYAPEEELIEENYLVGAPIESLYTYAMAKRMLYVGLRALHKQFGMPYLHLVPSTLYGPGQRAAGKQMHFIFDLIDKIIRGKLYGEAVVLWGDGFQRRELLFVDDFVKIMIELSHTCSNELINIGTGEEFTIRHFAKLICDKIGYDFEAIRFDTSRYVGAKSKCLAVAKVRKLVPSLSLTPLDVGLGTTLDWFLESSSRASL